MTPNKDEGLIVLALLVLVGLAVLAFTSHAPPQRFPDSVTVPDRSCYGDRCVQALPGGLVRETTRGGDVIAVWWH